MFNRVKKQNHDFINTPYPAVAVANYFIKCGKQEKIKLSLLSLIKLTYVAHGWHLAYYQQPLIDEAVEAWRYGPMITSIQRYFYEVRHQRHIKKPAKILNDETMKWFFPVINQDDNATLEVLNTVWAVYKNFSPLHLSALTHFPDSAWEKTDKLNQSPRLRNRHIQDCLIQAEFDKVIFKNSESN